MPWPDLNLKLSITRESDLYILNFTQPPWGGHLTTVRLPATSHPLFTSLTTQSSSFQKTIFWIICGTKDYVPLIAIESPSKPFTFARFYRCTDRKKRQRIFAEVGEPHSDSGATFMVKESDVCLIQQQFANLQINQESQ